LINPNIPPDEEQRLETLMELNVLDTPPEERFDRLTRMAKNSFDVPIALVSLVDSNRQWFKSCLGLPVSETTRDISFCGHAILENETFIIPDTLKDSRFADNPLVTNEPKIRFYAGVPLKALTGEKLGTFCIIDTKPRILNNVQIQALDDLAFLAERELAIIQIATFDDLTKISNRRGFMTLAKQGLSLSERHKVRATLIYFDLNKFKCINDKHGHLTGDKILIAFASALTQSSRDSDICARLRGDEFVALLFDISEIQLSDYINRVKISFNQKAKLSDFDALTTFAYGAVDYQQEKHTSIKNLLKDGDTAMYINKRNKITKIKNQISFLTSKIASGTD